MPGERRRSFRRRLQEAIACYVGLMLVLSFVAFLATALFLSPPIPAPSELRAAVLRYGLALVVLLAVGAAGAAALARWLARPVAELSEQAQRLAGEEGEEQPAEVPAQVDAELAALAEALREMAQRVRAQREDQRRSAQAIAASERMAAIGQLAAGIAHELSNVMTVAIGHAQLAQATQDPERIGAYLGLITSACAQANEITRNLLEFARPSEPKKKLSDIGECVRTACSLMEPSFVKAKVALEVDIPEELPRCVIDPRQIQQVLVNLLLNALEACDVGGRVAVSVRRAPAREEAEAAVEVVVSDDGCGIAPEDMERIFEPFYTTKTGEPPGTKVGTGLGLPVVRSIIEAHGGAISVKSERGAGATFTVTLPAQAAEAPAGEAEEEAAPVGRRLSVLVADEEIGVRGLLRAFLTSEGHGVIEAEDGEQALSALARRRFDVVVLDRALGGISSDVIIEAARAINPAPRIIVTTRSGETPPGADFVLRKPFGVREIREALAALLGVARSAG